jgi:hypothetical protein
MVRFIGAHRQWRAHQCREAAAWTPPVSLSWRGIHRWIGLGVIADNLVNIATYLQRRAAA